MTTTNLPSAMDGGMIRDIELAKALGYTRPGNIRNLIRRHLPALESFGLVHYSHEPIGTAYHLTTAQAAFILAKAGTKRADRYLVAVCEVFAMAAVLGRGVRLRTAQPFQCELEAGELSPATHAADAPPNAAEFSSRLRGTVCR